MSVNVDHQEFAIRLSIALGRDERTVILAFLEDQELWVASDNNHWPEPWPVES